MSALLLLFAVGPPADTLATGPKAQLLQSLYLQAGRALDREDPPSALAPIERALPLEREVFGGLRVRRTGWAVWLGQRYIEAERFADAQELIGEALRYLDHLPADHWRVREARWYQKHGRLLAGLNAADRARLKEVEKEFALANKTTSGEQPAENEKRVRRCLAVRLGLLGEDHLETAHALGLLAIQRREAGDWREGLTLFRRAIAAATASVGPEHRATARLMANYGGLLAAMGERREGREVIRRSLEIRRERLGEEHPEYQIGLVNYAAFLSRGREFDEAEPLYRQAIAHRTRRYGPDGISTASAQASLAVLLLSRGHGDLDEAERLLRQVEAVRKARFGTGHALYTDTLHNLAGLAMERGRLEDALEGFRRAADVRKGVYGERSYAYAASLHNQGRALLGLGRADEAREVAARALAIVEGRLEDAARVQSENEQLALARQMRAMTDLLLTLGGGGEYARVLARKGSVLLRQQQQRRLARLLAAEKDPEARALIERLEEAARRLALVPPNRPAEAARLTAQKVALERALAGSEVFKAAAVPAVDAVRRALPGDAVLIDYLFYRHEEQRPGERPGREDRLAAWVVRRDREPVRVDLGEAGTVELLLQAWVTSAARGGLPDGSALAARLWKPLADHVKGAKLILVSPDGNLARFPFAALPSGAGRYLIEDVELVHVPAPRLLAEPASGGARPPGLLVVGDVTFDPGAGRWRALPATRAEAKATAEAFAARFKDGAVTALGRDRATRPAVLGALTRSRFVHLATHGFFHPAGDLDPLLRSGLVLAGEGGSLTALEVGHADLSGCELAVLSACETGLGQRTGGEGMLGLQRALLVAGCRRVVSSLWSVDDAATSVLMERFYHHLWKDGQTARAALRLAQLDVLRGPELVEKRLAELRERLPRAEVALVRGLGKVGAPLPKGGRHCPPAWWAGWQLSGDWR